MAEKIVRTLVDDIDGSEAARTRRFSVDGKSFSIDLSEKNSEKLDKALALFVEHATAERGSRSADRPRSSSTSPTRDYDIVALRAWAKKARIDLPSRGRIPGAIVERFKASQK